MQREGPMKTQRKGSLCGPRGREKAYGGTNPADVAVSYLHLQDAAQINGFCLSHRLWRVVRLPLESPHSSEHLGEWPGVSVGGGADSGEEREKEHCPPSTLGETQRWSRLARRETPAESWESAKGTMALPKSRPCTKATELTRPMAKLDSL